jgi:hypothetical protein
VAAADRATAVVAAHLTHAATHLLTAYRLLSAPAAVTAIPPHGGAAESLGSYTTWQEFLATLEPAAAQALLRALAEVVSAARRAALVAQDDGDVESLRRDVGQALAAVARIQRYMGVPTRNGPPPAWPARERERRHGERSSPP